MFRVSAASRSATETGGGGGLGEGNVDDVDWVDEVDAAAWTSAEGFGAGAGVGAVGQSTTFSGRVWAADVCIVWRRLHVCEGVGNSLSDPCNPYARGAGRRHGGGGRKRGGSAAAEEHRTQF